jgi:hypothetical protein
VVTPSHGTVPVHFNYTFAELLLVALVVDAMVLAIASMLGTVVGRRTFADFGAVVDELHFWTKGTVLLEKELYSWTGHLP